VPLEEISKEENMNAVMRFFVWVRSFFKPKNTTNLLEASNDDIVILETSEPETVSVPQRSILTTLYLKSRKLKSL